MDWTELVFYEVAKAKFKEKYKHNPKEHFKYSFGVMNFGGQNPEKIVLKQEEYIRSFPIHKSQKETPCTGENIWFGGSAQKK